MKMRTLIAIFLLAAPAYAQKKPVKAPPKAQVIKIDDPDEIGGEVPSGQGEVLSVLKHAPKPGMIKIRENFTPEMYATALNL
jgi:hypothetical protein